MPIKVMNSAGQGSYANIALGMRYAADQGAQVLNLSLGGPNPSFILEDACKYAYEKGCVIIVASGNNGGNVLYPAAYNNYCLAVAATDDKDTRVSFSNFGLEVDVAAPGVFVFGALFSPLDPETLNNYGWGNGTSFSCPYVAGAAALLLHYKPFLTNDEVMELIRVTADDVNSAIYPGVDGFLGYGRINLKTLLGPYVL
jgi:subtilisin family serine protease